MPARHALRQERLVVPDTLAVGQDHGQPIIHGCEPDLTVAGLLIVPYCTDGSIVQAPPQLSGLRVFSPPCPTYLDDTLVSVPVSAIKFTPCT